MNSSITGESSKSKIERLKKIMKSQKLTTYLSVLMKMFAGY